MKGGDGYVVAKRSQCYPLQRKVRRFLYAKLLVFIRGARRMAAEKNWCGCETNFARMAAKWLFTHPPPARAASYPGYPTQEHGTRSCRHLFGPPLPLLENAHLCLQADFERALSVWAAARTKHQRLLRPAFGSADRRDELDDLLSREAGRASEASEAIASFRRELMREEAATARDHAARIADCFGGVAAILDRQDSALDRGFTYVTLCRCNVACSCRCYRPAACCLNCAARGVPSIRGMYVGVSASNRGVLREPSPYRI